MSSPLEAKYACGIPAPEFALVVHNSDGRVLLRVRNDDGTFEWGDGATPEEAGEAMADAINSMLGLRDGGPG